MTFLIISVLELFVFVLFVYSILSWIVMSGDLAYDSPVLKFERLLGRICEPVLRPVRRLIPPVRIGGAALDLSVIIVWLAITLVIIPILQR
jgi:YggT family protein